MKTTFYSFGRGRTILGYIRQHTIFWDLVIKNSLLTNLLKMDYCLIIVLWSIFLSVPLVEISAHSGLNLTSPRKFLHMLFGSWRNNLIVSFYVVWFLKGQYSSKFLCCLFLKKQSNYKFQCCFILEETNC